MQKRLYHDPMPVSGILIVTVSSLASTEWVAVNTIVDERVARDVIPRLKAARAAGIVEYPLNKVVL